MISSLFYLSLGSRRRSKLLAGRYILEFRDRNILEVFLFKLRYNLPVIRNQNKITTKEDMLRNFYHIIEIKATLTRLKKWNTLSLIWNFARTTLYLMNIVFIQFIPLLKEEIIMTVQVLIKT